MADLLVAQLAAQLELHLVHLLAVTTDIQMVKSTDTLTGYHWAHWTENLKADLWASCSVLRKEWYLGD